MDPEIEQHLSAAALNLNWDRLRQGLPPVERSHSSYPPGSIGDGYERAMKLRADARKAKGITWTTEQHSRDDWPRAWKHIEPLLGDCDPKTVTPAAMSSGAGAGFPSTLTPRQRWTSLNPAARIFGVVRQRQRPFT
jgi:hypothetical protein